MRFLGGNPSFIALIFIFLVVRFKKKIEKLIFLFLYFAGEDRGVRAYSGPGMHALLNRGVCKQAHRGVLLEVGIPIVCKFCTAGIEYRNIVIRSCHNCWQCSYHLVTRARLP